MTEDTKNVKKWTDEELIEIYNTPGITMLCHPQAFEIMKEIRERHLKDRCRQSHKSGLMDGRYRS